MHKYLLLLIELAKKKNVKISIVISPCQKTYTTSIPPYNELFCELEEICKTENIMLISFYNSTIFDSSDFYDEDHLNLKGAKKFTNELKLLQSRECGI